MLWGKSGLNDNTSWLKSSSAFFFSNLNDRDQQRYCTLWLLVMVCKYVNSDTCNTLKSQHSLKIGISDFEKQRNSKYANQTSPENESIFWSHSYLISQRETFYQIIIHSHTDFLHSMETWSLHCDDILVNPGAIFVTWLTAVSSLVYSADMYSLIVGHNPFYKQ